MNNEVTDKTDKQANRLVKKRKNNQKRLDNLEDRKKDGKKTLLGDVRTKLRKNRKKNLQKKIDANPTAQKWRKDGKKKATTKKEKYITDGASKYKTGGFNTGAGSWIETSSVSSID